VLARQPRSLMVASQPSSSDDRTADPCSGAALLVTGRGEAPDVSDSLPLVAPAAVVAVMAPATIIAVPPTVVVALPVTGPFSHLTFLPSSKHLDAFPPIHTLPAPVTRGLVFTAN
jgi:hypothetical protein